MAYRDVILYTSFEERREKPMNNFKKFVAVLLGVVMACVFATSAFADTASDKAAIIAKLNAFGLTGYEDVVNSLDANGVATLVANRDTLKAQANQVVNYLHENHSAADQAANLQNALNNVDGILKQAGVTASVNVKVEGNTVVATATAKTAAASGSTTITETVDPSKETNKKAAANPVVASSNAVIKATGDNAAVVFVAAALAVAGVLGMAVRKERAL